jgi:hypothetical protein
VLEIIAAVAGVTLLSNKVGTLGRPSYAGGCMAHQLLERLEILGRGSSMLKFLRGSFNQSARLVRALSA